MIAAIAILYHPDLNTLPKLVNSVLPQVDHLYFVDNTPDIKLDIRQFKSDKVTYISLGKNYGIAKAQNEGIRIAKAAGFSHVLLLDQDSCLTPGLIPTLKYFEENLLSKDEKVAAVGPLYHDSKTKEYAQATRFKYFHMASKRLNPEIKEPVSADYIIASGSLIRMDALDQIGLMQEDLFIDGVDVEWGQRARAKGYSFYIVPAATMEHCLGDTFVTILGRNIFLHSDLRNMYIVRNSCYMLTLLYVDIWWKLTITCRIPFYLLVYSMTSQKKWKAFNGLLRACLDGFHGKLGQIASK